MGLFDTRTVPAFHSTMTIEGGIIGTGAAVGERSLASIRVLEGVGRDLLRSIENACQWESYKPGSWLFERGQETSHVYFVLHGVVRVLNYSANGRVVRFAAIGPGGIFGELAAIDSLPRSATVVADRPCFVAKLSARDFREMIGSSPALAMALVQHMARVSRACDEQIMDLAELNASQRVCLRLLRLAEPDPIAADSWLIYPLPTQAALAGDAGTTRETVARVLGRLTAQGVVQRKGRSLYIRDRKLLEGLAVREQPDG